MTIQESLKEKFPKVKMDSHESDLYVDYSPEIWEYLKSEYQFFKNCGCFISLIDGEKWIDIPFAYDRFWQVKKY